MIPWVKWSEILKRRDYGGLGINSLKHLNEALISKWVWRFHNEDNAVWVQVIKSIHGLDCINKNPNNALKHSNWNMIIKHLGRMRNFEVDVRQYIKKKCVNGRDTSFWKDPWMHCQPLKDNFPRLYALETDKSISVSGRLGDAANRWNWIREPSRGCTGDNLIELEEMIATVQLTNQKDM